MRKTHVVFIWNCKQFMDSLKHGKFVNFIRHFNYHVYTLLSLSCSSFKICMSALTYSGSNGPVGGHIHSGRPKCNQFVRIYAKWRSGNEAGWVLHSACQHVFQIDRHLGYRKKQNKIQNHFSVHDAFKYYGLLLVSRLFLLFLFFHSDEGCYDGRG